MFYYSGYYYLLISSGTCCGYDTSKPKPGDEYRIIMGRSTSATGGFVRVVVPHLLLRGSNKEYQVDKSGKKLTAGGGTTLLASHGTTYGPGGQYVESLLQP